MMREQLSIWTDYKRINATHFLSENPVRFISIDPFNVSDNHLMFESVVVSNLDGEIRNARYNIKARKSSLK